MTEAYDKARLIWETGWDGHEKAQLLRMAALPFEEKLRWLDQAQDVIQTIQRGKQSPFRNQKGA